MISISINDHFYGQNNFPLSLKNIGYYTNSDNTQCKKYQNL